MINVRYPVHICLDWNRGYSICTLPEEYRLKEIPDHWKKLLEQIPEDVPDTLVENVLLKNIIASLTPDYSGRSRAFNIEGYDMIGILYFSSTGNSLYIAQRIQNRIGGQLKYIPNYEGNGNEFDKIILVTPIYSYGMPTFVYDIIPKLNKQKELFVIQNYGGIVGGADYFIYQYAKQHKLNIKAVYILKMPENFTLTFTVPKFYIKHTLKKADKYIDNVIDSINSGNYRVPKQCNTKRREHNKIHL